jgi:hypothetical protein
MLSRVLVFVQELPQKLVGLLLLFYKRIQRIQLGSVFHGIT